MGKERVVSSHQIHCAGVKNDEEKIRKVSAGGVPLSAIVEVYDNGNTIVLCPRLSGGGCEIVNSETDPALCPYVRQMPFSRS